MPTRCLPHLLILCTLTALCAPGTRSAPVEEPPVGWFNLYTVFDVGMDKVPESGARMLATLGGCNLPCRHAGQDLHSLRVGEG